MSNTSITMNMDSELKQQLQKLLSELGLDMATFFTMSAKQAVREQAIPFMVTMEVPNAETRQAMLDTLEGKGLSRGYTSFKEMMENIDVDD